MSEQPITVRRPGELIFSLLLLLFSVIALGLAFQIDQFDLSGPSAMPIMAASVLVITGLLNSRTAWALPAAQTDTGFFATITPPVIVNFFLLGIAYIALLNLAGFIIASLIYLFVSVLYLHRQGWLLAFFVSINSLAVIYVVFRLIFKVILPEGAFGL